MEPNQAVMNKNFSDHNGTLYKDEIVTIDERKTDEIFRVIDDLGRRWLITKDYLNINEKQS